jgi:Tol biopolymer transport system component
VDGRVNGGTRTRYLAQAFNADGSRIAFIDDVDERGLGRLVVSDLAFKRQTTAATGVNGMILSPDRTRVAAVVASGGGEGVVAFSFARPDLVERGRTYDGAHVLTFSPDGSSLAYLAERSGKGLVVMDDKEEPLPAGGVAGMPVIRPGRGVVGVLTVSGDSVVLREYFGKAGQGEVGHEEAEGLVYGGDGGSYAYAARKGERWFVVANGREGPSFDRVVTPQFSPDGKWLVYRARKDGRRFVVIANADGTTARQGPAYEQVHEVHFSTDGKSVAYGAKDGRQLIWKVEPL